MSSQEKRSLSFEKKDQLDYLRSPHAIRRHCEQVYQLVKDGKGRYFSLHEEKLEPLCDYVLSVIRQNYPDLKVPFHSRWRHFRGPHGDCLSDMEKTYLGLSEGSRTQAMMEVVLVSVLLDAGAGASWRYRDPRSNKLLSRSEGLAFASWDLVKEGRLTKGTELARVDALGLQNITEESFCEAFQVTTDNPLVGVTARVHILKELGKVVSSKPEIFGSEVNPYLGGLFDYLRSLASSSKSELEASTILKTVLETFSTLWPRSATWQGDLIGDVGDYEGVRGDFGVHDRIPFHKLSQWLTYSFIEPLEASGLQVTGLDQLTGLPEYRNGGLFIDREVLSLKDSSHQSLWWGVQSPLVVEWRALTVCLLDKLGAMIREKLQEDSKSLPLVCILEGGTWWAGRLAAKERRPDGSPPLKLKIEGSLF